MATGRTVPAVFDRVYMDGLDMSGYSRSIGPLAWEYADTDLRAMSDPVMGGLPGIAKISPGTLNANFDNTATVGLHALASASGTRRLVTVARGIRAEPAAGDPCFTAYSTQKNYMAVDESGAATVTIEFGELNQVNVINYARPWGVLLHPKGAETTANTAVGVDDTLGGAATANGGWFWWHALTGNGTVTLKAQHAVANNDGSFADITGATSGSIDPTSAPAFGIAAVALGTTINRYLRFQIAFTLGTTCTFLSGFHRG